MALVDMKRISLLAMRKDQGKLLGLLQRAGCVQIAGFEEEEVRAYLAKDRAELDAAEERLGRIRWALSQLSKYEPKQSMIAQMSMPEAGRREAEAVQADGKALMNIVARVESLERKSGDLRGLEMRAKLEMEQLTPWRGLDIPVEQLRDTLSTAQFSGTVDKRAAARLENDLAGLPARMDRISELNDSLAIWLVSHRSALDAVREALKAAGFASVQFPAPQGTPDQQYRALSKRLEEITESRKEMERELREMAAEAPRLKLLYELAAEEVSRQEASTRFAETGSVFLMEGWVPAPRCAGLEKKLRAASPDCAVEFRDARDDEQPPTLMNNNKFATPFEAVVSNYSLPDPRGLDPTFIMAPFFVCFFGMMVSDAGYGLIMAILIPLVIRFVKPKEGLRKIMWVLAIGGIGTVFWGAMYDGWFGLSVKPMLLNPLEQPLEMMMLCMGVGAVHLLTGLGIGVYMNFKRGKPLDALFDQFTWLAILFGIGMLLVPGLQTVGMALAAIGAVTVVLTAGRDKPFPKRLISGLGKLYDITGWLSDLLSYLRLFGMGLATGVIALVFNTLAGMLLSGGVIGIVFGVLLLVVGHGFNMAINVLGAYVHSCRLQYIEFFGKFYEDGGYPFKPLTQNPRYIAIRENQADGAQE